MPRAGTAALPLRSERRTNAVKVDEDRRLGSSVTPAKNGWSRSSRSGPSRPRPCSQAMVDRSVLEMKQIGFFESANSFSPQQLLTIASLVQAEGNAEDFAKISRVIRNRIKAGMPLQFDSTVHYVKKSRGKVFLSTESTLITSPYNTYKRFGLPIAPIGNPGVAAMRAALNPEPGDWLYFITVKPGDTRFTKSHDEFLQWKNEYLKNLKAGMFK